MREGGRLYTGYASVSSETHNLQRVFHPRGGGGGSPINRLYRYVPHKRVCFFIRFGLILQADYYNADRTTWKLTLHDINTTPKELKTERDCSHSQLFRPRWGSSVWRNNQKALVQNIRALWFKLWPRTLNTHRITPYHVSSGGQESKCQVDVSQRK